ncbi:MAG: hypothetical protein M3063_15695 [Actinomycetota bacterium]|nr:hypothetical protein [Actinomycetota bacterium]
MGTTSELPERQDGTVTTISGYGITATLPAAWEGRITKLAPVAPAAAAGRAIDAGRVQAAAVATGTAPGTSAPAASLATAPQAEVTLPFLHLANFPLPPSRGAFGTGAVELMKGTDSLIVLLEYSVDSLGTALFAPAGAPRVLYPREFHPRALQRILAGQAGYQAFFTESGRPFSLYVVLGSLAQAVTSVPGVNRVLAGLRIDKA